MTLLTLNNQLISKFNDEIRSYNQCISSMQTFNFDSNVTERINLLESEVKAQCGKLVYIQSTCGILNEYASLLKQPIIKGVDCKTTKRKREIVKLYLQTVSQVIRQKRWYDIVPYSIDFKPNSCSVCTEPTNIIETADGKKICDVCSCEIQTLEIGNTHMDYNRASIIGKFIYNRVLHFQDCIKQFQGKQNCKIPPSVYADLDSKFKSYRLLIDSDNPHVKYSKISKQHIMMFLKELKYVKHYENVNVIYYTLTSKMAEDIGHLEQQLIEDFKELVTLYDSLHSKDKPEELDRKNFLNVQYLLFQLLRRHGHKCKIEDFSILKTSDRKLFHDKICCNLFQQLGWNFTPTF